MEGEIALEPGSDDPVEGLTAEAVVLAVVGGLLALPEEDYNKQTLFRAIGENLDGGLNS